MNEFFKMLIKSIASFTGETTSTFGLYQPKKPDSLMKTDKKK